MLSLKRAKSAGARRIKRAQNHPRAMARTQTERTALSETRLVEAARELILTRGTHYTTLTEVGERAGYSRSLAAIRFGSKEKLFGEIASAFARSWNEACDEYVRSKRGLEAFRAVFDAVVNFILKDPNYLRAIHILYFETVGSSELMRNQQADQHAHYRSKVASWIREGIEDGEVKSTVEPESIAVQYVSFFSGTVYQWLARPDAINIARSVYDFRDSLLAFICVAEAPVGKRKGSGRPRFRNK
jgi:AcrR family transcriptional regulator